MISKFISVFLYAHVYGNTKIITEWDLEFSRFRAMAPIFAHQGLMKKKWAFFFLWRHNVVMDGRLVQIVQEGVTFLPMSYTHR